MSDTPKDMSVYANRWGFRVREDLASMWPDLDPKELLDLQQSIATIGMVEPITVNEKMEVIEGHQRLRAWIGLGKEEAPVYRVVRTGGDRAKELMLALELNARRRHVDKSQLSIIIAKTLQQISQLSDSRAFRGETHTSDNTAHENTSRLLSKVKEETGISKSTLSKASSVVKNAPPEVVREVEKGRLSVEQAYRMVKPPQPSAPSPPPPAQPPQTPTQLPNRISKDDYEKVYSTFVVRPYRETTVELGARYGVDKEEIIRVVNLIRAEKGYPPVSYGTLPNNPRVTMTEHLLVEEQEVASRTAAPAPAPAAPAPAAPTRIADKVHYCVSDEWLVKGIMAYAKIKGVDAQEALELLVSECLTMHLDMSW
ncbi:MAG: ParB N-terminal domain-containing protein [Nitrososphaerota archaeon]|nr:ParB N-terminal domain-containing protein [Nitrososphaerota archaeon]